MKVAKIDGAYNRRFIREVYEKNDGKAKEAIMNYLIKNGHEILDSQENFSFDIKSKKGDNIYFSEAEMKNQWSGDWPEEQIIISLISMSSEQMQRWHGESKTLLLLNQK